MEEHGDAVSQEIGHFYTQKWCFDKGFDNGLKGILDRWFQAFLPGKMI